MTEHQGNFLFLIDGVPDVPPESGTESTGAGHMRRGMAGQYLALADQLIRGYEAYIRDGLDVDLISYIADIPRHFQVKATQNLGETFGRVITGSRGNFTRRYGRTLDSYKGKIDAFAFVYLPCRAVYYVHIDAIASPSLSLADSCWTRQACELSFSEIMRRFRGEAP